jgi:hypothetical protein
MSVLFENRGKPEVNVPWPEPDTAGCGQGVFEKIAKICAIMPIY